MSMKADKNLTIQRYYRKMFVKLVFLPLILIFFAGMYLVLRQIDHEQQDKLSIAGKSAADILEREMSALVKPATTEFLHRAVKLMVSYLPSIVLGE